MHKSLQQIREQGGSCKGLICPECGLRDYCHITVVPKTIEELNAERLQWIEELDDARP